MTVSRIYGWTGTNPDRATAIANILADIEPFITADARGVKVLDKAGLKMYLTTHFGYLSDAENGLTNTPQTPATIAAAAGGVNINGLVDSLDAAINEERLSKDAAWPRTASAMNRNMVAAIIEARTKARDAANAVTQQYRWTQTGDLAELVRTFYNEETIDSRIPAGEQILNTTLTWRYAYRTDKGEVGKPSNACPLVTIDQNDVVTVTAAAPPANRFVDTVLWYRAATGNAGVAFLYAGEKAVSAGLSFADTTKPGELGEPCPSVEWDPPPAGLRGMTPHPSGFAVGFYDNTVCFSVGNRMYAWPTSYRKTTKSPVVGLRVSGTTVFVGTMGEPVLMSGADPAFMSAEIVRGGLACRSSRSIAATSRGFVYASAEGIAVCSGTIGTELITRDHFTPKQWEALKPESIFAVAHNGCYLFWWNNGVTRGCYSLSIETGRLATLDITASAAFVNQATGKLYAVNGTSIVEVFGAAGRRTGVWKSGRVRLPRPSGPAWRQLAGDFEAGPVTMRVTGYVIRSGSSKTTTYTIGNGNPGRTPPGFYDEYEVEIEGQSTITEAVLAPTTDDLKQL